MGKTAPRILFLAQGYPSAKDPMSGVFHQRQMELILAAGLEATLVVPVPWVPPGLAARSPRWAFYRDLPERQSDGALRIYRPRYLAMPRENRLGLPWLFQGLAVRRLLAEIGYGRPDLVHGFFGLPTGVIARALARRWRVPYTVSLHGDDVTRHPYFHRLNRALLGKVCRDAAFTCATSIPLAEEAAELTGAAVTPLSIGIDFRHWRNEEDRRTLRAQLGLPADGFVLLFAGSLTVAKGVDDLRHALASDPIAGLTLVAVGDGPLRAALTHEVGARCVGVQPQAELARYMAAADAIILPSHHEGLGMVLVEASALGLPAAGSDTGGIRELLGDGKGYLFPPHQPDAIGQTIRAMMAAPEERAARCRRLHDYVRRHHDIETNTARLVAVWRGLCDGTGAAAARGRPDLA